MIRPIGRNWWVFGLCAVVLASATVWLTLVTLRLDSEKATARAEMAHQAATSEMLWQMDTWLAPQLAHEAARPYFEYEAYYPQQKAYTRILTEIEQGEVLIPSPLLAYRSELFPLHFQLSDSTPLDERDALSSPQVPKSNWRDLTQVTFGDQLDLQPPARRLEELRSKLGILRTRLQECYTDDATETNLPISSPNAQATGDYSSRSRSTDQARGTVSQNLAWAKRGTRKRGRILVGPLLPIWVTDPAAQGAASDAPNLLLFVRRVQLSDQNLFQGFVADWERLRSALLAQVNVASNKRSMRLTPIGTDQRDVQMLATIPVRLQSPMPPPENHVETTTLLVLCVVWGGLLASLIAVGFAVHSTNQLGQRRARFASTVTHELRTPLTTFRMYSEMLADGMVQDSEKRREYLQTLTGEADRLSRLVENVLSYARIEDGRFRCHPERIDLESLADRLRPIFEQRCKESGHRLVMTTHGTVTQGAVVFDADVDALTQILFNLVDNACKYAAEAEDRRIEIDARVRGEMVEIEIHDHGPGIAPNLGRAVFRPFERAGNAHTPDQPGVGLGLALARALAEDLGGQLELVPDRRPGATFKLSLRINTGRRSR